MATKRPPKAPKPAAQSSPAWYELPADAPPPLHPRAFLATLTAQGIRLTLEPDGTLRCRAPQGVLTAELQAQIAHYKADLLLLLSATGARNASACQDVWPHVFLAMTDGRRCVRCNQREEEKP